MCKRVSLLFGGTQLLLPLFKYTEAGVVELRSCIGDLPVLVGAGDNPVGLRKGWYDHRYREYAGLRARWDASVG